MGGGSQKWVNLSCTESERDRKSDDNTDRQTDECEVWPLSVSRRFLQSA